MVTLRAAAQDRRIPRHKAESAGVGGDVGPRFVNDPDDADRHRNPADSKPVGPLPFAQQAAERVVQGSHLLDTRRHRCDAAGVEGEAIEQRAAQP